MPATPGLSTTRRPSGIPVTAPPERPGRGDARARRPPSGGLTWDLELGPLDSRVGQPRASDPGPSIPGRRALTPLAAFLANPLQSGPAVGRHPAVCATPAPWVGGPEHRRQGRGAQPAAAERPRRNALMFARSGRAFAPFPPFLSGGRTARRSERAGIRAFSPKP